MATETKQTKKPMLSHVIDPHGFHLIGYTRAARWISKKYGLNLSPQQFRQIGKNGRAAIASNEKIDAVEKEYPEMLKWFAAYNRDRRTVEAAG